MRNANTVIPTFIAIGFWLFSIKRSFFGAFPGTEGYIDQETQSAQKKRGRPKKYETKFIPVKIHLTWTAKRASKDKGDRDRMLERLNKRLDKPYQLKASIMRGCNQYLQMEVDTKNWKLNEEKIDYAARFDGYYAVITNDLGLSTDEVSKIYGGLWKIEESFRVLKTDLKARPVFVWSDDHIKGHFVICFISLCVMRYIQYLLDRHAGKSVSAEEIMKALKEPTAVVLGEFPKVAVTPIQISQTYLDLANILQLPTLKTNMTLTKFRACTKLNLAINLKK